MLRSDDPPGAALVASEVHALGEQGWFVRDGVLGPAVAAAAAGVIDAMAGAGGLRPAGVGRGPDRRLDPATRGDAIAWIDPPAAPAGLARLVAWFIALRDDLNRLAYLGLDRVEIQLARYPGDGARYRRHRDAFRASPSSLSNRAVTAIYYANPGWRAGDGGCLRLHLVDGPRDVDPVADRVVVFLSEEVEHEVLPTRAPRRAVTAWLRRRAAPLAPAGRERPATQTAKETAPFRE